MIVKDLEEQLVEYEEELDNLRSQLEQQKANYEEKLNSAEQAQAPTPKKVQPSPSKAAEAEEKKNSEEGGAKGSRSTELMAEAMNLRKKLKKEEENRK